MNITQSFLKVDLQALANDCHDSGKFEVMERKITYRSRWYVYYTMVFCEKSMNRYWRTEYHVGATEQQDVQPYEHDPERVNAVEVFPQHVVRTEYVTRDQLADQSREVGVVH